MLSTPNCHDIQFLLLGRFQIACDKACRKDLAFEMCQLNHKWFLQLCNSPEMHNIELSSATDHAQRCTFPTDRNPCIQTISKATAPTICYVALSPFRLFFPIDSDVLVTHFLNSLCFEIGSKCSDDVIGVATLPILVVDYDNFAIKMIFVDLHLSHSKFIFW
jgi:hypothetical protein